MFWVHAFQSERAILMHTLGKNSLAVLEDRVDPKLVEVVKHAITITEQDFCLLKNGGARSAEEQNKLFKQGSTQKDGYKKPSNHQVKSDGFGKAVDLVPWGNGSFFYDDTWEAHYPIAVAMSKASRALNIPIMWGGNWYERMDQYPDTLEGIKEAVERYKKQHAGVDFIDAPHFQLV